MRIEHLFSKLESRTSLIFNKITKAVSDGRGHIDLLEKDVHTLFKFMHLSVKRSKQYHDDFKNPHRDNDFVVQRLLENARRRGQSDDPSRFWLESLLYLLETSHEQILADAETAGNPSMEDTYKYFTETYALQIWKAAEGHEFFLNERLVDFEGDTTSNLGIEETDTGQQLIMRTSEDLIHQILPISPNVALVFCDESRCWDSPFADAMHRAKIPYPSNSLLKHAPHKDIINISVPSERRGKKTYPATVAWRVVIGTLTPPHHRIISCYSLSHAKSLLIARQRASFERAKLELAAFGRERAAAWKRQGIRCEDPGYSPPANANPRSLEQSAERFIAALDSVLALVQTTRDPLPRSKENSIKAWYAMAALDLLGRHHGWTHPPREDEAERQGPRRLMHPALKKAFEVAYGPKPPAHRDLIEVDFVDFVHECVGEESFVKLTTAIDVKIRELVHSEQVGEQIPGGVLPVPPPGGDGSAEEAEEVMNNPCFKSVFVAAQVFDVMRWLFEERQDVLAQFVKGSLAPGEAVRGGRQGILRMRARRV